MRGASYSERPVKQTVTRSPLRLLLYSLLAVPLILLAVDMTISYRWFAEPETRDVTEVIGSTTDASGEVTEITTIRSVLTPRGEADRRRDVFIGGAMFLGGAALMGWAIKELVSPTAFLEVDDEGLLVRVDGPRRPARRFNWDGIVEVRSGVLDDDGAPVPVLSLRLLDIEQVPYLPAGARAEPPWLHLYSEEWETPAHQLAPLLDQQAARSRPTGERG